MRCKARNVLKRFDYNGILSSFSQGQSLTVHYLHGNQTQFRITENYHNTEISKIQLTSIKLHHKTDVPPDQMNVSGLRWQLHSILWVPDSYISTLSSWNITFSVLATSWLRMSAEFLISIYTRQNERRARKSSLKLSHLSLSNLFCG